MIQDGDRVAFCGYPQDGVEIGDRGRVIDAGHTGSSVRWITGAKRNHISLVAHEDLVVNGSLEGHPLVPQREEQIDGLQVRAVYDQGGSISLLNALNIDGCLDAFSSIAQDALTLVATRVRQDPSIATVLSALDEDEAADFVAVASAQLLRDAFGEEGQ